MKASGDSLSGWRKIANAVWFAPKDPQIYGMLEVDATAVRAFIRASRAEGRHVTTTHLVGRATAHALQTVPDLNVRILGSRAIPRPSVDIFFITAVGGGRDLSGVKVVRASEKSVDVIADELRARSAAMKDGRDPDLARAKKAMENMPLPLLRVALRAAAWWAGDLGKSLPALGLGASPFGSAMVSSVGMLGIQVGFSPLAWMYKVPLLVLAGEIAEKPVAIAGRVEVRPILPITATIDHRYADGAQIAKAMNAFREYLAAPEDFEPAVSRRTARGDTTMKKTIDELKGDIQKTMTLLHTLSDEARLKVHLAGMDAKEAWAKLEPKLEEAEKIAEDASEATLTTIRSTARRLEQLVGTL